LKLTNGPIIGTIPEPAAVLTERKRSSIRMPPPRSKSPIKTFLQSPARRHPSLGPVSSPTRGSIISPSRANVHTSVNRRLDFSVDDLDRNHEKAPIRSSPLKRTIAQKNSFTEKLTNGARLSPVVKMTSAQKHREQEQYESVQPDNDLDLGNNGDPYQVMGDDYGLDDQYQDEQYAAPASSPELDTESPLQATKKRRGTALADEPVAKKSKSKPQSSVGSSRGKGSASHAVVVPKAPVRNADGKPAKGARRPPKVPKASNTEVTKKPGSRNAERKDSSPSGVSSSPIIHRGPPRPKHNRGLYILRRETPDDGAQTRSGRHVIKPVAYWKNETVVYGDDEEADGDASFLLPTVKEVIRADRVEQPKSKKGTRKAAGTGKSRKPRQESESEEDDDLAEPWESEPGRIYGAIRTWDPEDPIGEESGEKEDEIALSSAAIITRDIAGASFRFAKTLTLPFFGSGMVDLPPGAVKKPKNSRRMQMVFFVFSGRVSVTVNDNAFRIGKGGMWQVPRGEFSCADIGSFQKPNQIHRELLQHRK
jgi:centromere protein C